MGNCLVTKLKGTVNSDSLNKLGVLSFKVKVITPPAGQSLVASDYKLNLIVNDAVTIKVTNDSYGFWGTNSSWWGDQSKKVNSYTLQNGEMDIYFEPGEYTVEITNKYAITSVIVQQVKAFVFSNVEYLNNLTVWRCIQCDGINFNLDNLKDWEDIVNVFATYSGVIGDLANLKDLKTLHSLNVERSSGIYGNIMDLAELTELTNLNFTGIANIKGEVTEFAEALFNNEQSPRTSGTLAIYGGTTGLKYNNQSFSKVDVTFTAEGPTYSVIS